MGVRKRKWAAALGAISGAAAVGLAQAAPPARPVSPFLTAAEYLAARGPDGGGDCLTATYSVSTWPADARLSFVSCPTYLAMTTSPPGEAPTTSIRDFKLERTLVSLDASSVVNTSNHAEAYLSLRLAERYRRRTSGDAFAAACLESWHSIPFASSTFVRPDRRAFAGGESFVVGGTELSRVEYGDALRADLAPALRRALIKVFKVQPPIAEAIAGRGFLPKALVGPSVPSACGPRRYQLESVSIAPVAFPLDPSKEMESVGRLFRGFGPANESQPENIFRNAVQNGPSPDFEGRIVEMEALLKGGDPLGAYLAGDVLMWTYEKDTRDCGRTVEATPCGRFRSAYAAAARSNNPDVVRYAKAKEAERKSEPEAGIDALNSIKPKDQRTANRMQTLRAMILIELRDRVARAMGQPFPSDASDRAFGAALTEEPAMTAIVYRAGADLLRRNEARSNENALETFTAWTLFDAARAMPHYRGGLADQIDSIERDNRRLMPDLFPETSPQK